MPHVSFQTIINWFSPYFLWLKEHIFQKPEFGCQYQKKIRGLVVVQILENWPGIFHFFSVVNKE